MAERILNPLEVPDKELDDFDWDSFVEEDSMGEDETEPLEETSEEGITEVEEEETEVEEEEEEVIVEELEEKEEEISDELDELREELTESDDETKLEDEEEVTESEEEVAETEESDAEAERKAKDDEGEGEELEEITTEDIGDVTDLNNKEVDAIVEEAFVAKEQMDILLSPFKANGKDMTIDNVEDARTLMQMGANYNKKMLSLKPNLKVVRMLQNQDLMDEDKINFLIDLHKGNPDAIKKLINDNKLDLDVLEKTTEDKKYVPNTYTVDDKVVELEQAFEEIRETTAYETTLNIITDKWDDASQDMIANDPSIIPVINKHVELGIYEQVTTVVDRERALGRLKGISDLAAYQVVGDALFENGSFKDKQTEDTAAISQATKTKKVVDPKLKDKKRAASSTKNLGKALKKDLPDILGMSDEDFEKLDERFQ